MDAEYKWTTVGLLAALFMVLATVGSCTVARNQIQGDIIKSAVERGISPVLAICAWRTKGDTAACGQAIAQSEK